jgi:hypothetical protein
MTTAMRARRLVVTVVPTLVWLGANAHVASADPKADVEKKIKSAMESYDLMDYDAAKKLLNQAVSDAKKAKLDKDGVAARAHLDLGIVAFVNGDQDGAKQAFVAAVQVDAKIQIDPAYKSPDMAKLLEEARGEAKGGGAKAGGDKGTAVKTGGDKGGGEQTFDLGSAVDCNAVKGVEHTVIDTAKANAALTIEASLGGDVKASKVAVMYRPEGASDFSEAKMIKQGECKYVGQIPAAGMKGSLVHYYIAAYGGDGTKPIASKGSAGSPNIMELTKGSAKPSAGDNDDPLKGTKTVATSDVSTTDGGDVSSGVTVGGGAKHIMIGVSGGAGFGYLSGTTEALNPVKSAGFGPSPVVIQPELAYMVNAQLSIGVAGRIGFPIGANIDGHATLAPAGLLRVRYGLAADGEGVRVMFEAGAGIIRHTLKLDNSMPGMDTDVVAQGPLLLGAGVGYKKSLSGAVAFIADLHALAGIAVTDHLGSAPKLNSGVTADLSLGLALGF